MTTFNNMKDFFFAIFTGIPAFLISEPIIYFVSVFLGICVIGMFTVLFHINRR